VTEVLPHAIVLNGASSSGKTSIAKLLQESLPVLYVNFSIDSILYGLPPTDLSRMLAGERIDRPEYDYDKLVEGYHAAAASLLAAGNRLIIDNAMTSLAWKTDLQDRLQPYRAFWVGVTCDEQTLAKREHQRGDRALGSAQREAPAVHEGVLYDLMVDTTSCSSQSASSAILAALGVQQ
jgi:chloramphenicol 3-O phosphotransferase